tara:strand:+ start:166715 stop:167455 length:741 start_codon:yes stop_codon:yes gene_type:complete
MKLFKIVLACFLLGGLTQSLAADSDPRTLTVRGEAEVELEPDFIEMSFRLIEENASATRAKDRVDERITAVIRALEEFAIANEDISMSGVEVRRIFERDRNENQEFDRFEVSRSLTLKLRNINDYEALTAELVEAGIGELNGIQSGVDNEDELTRQALQAAARDARIRAEAIVSGLGVGLGAPLEVGENQLRPIINFQQRNADGRALEAVMVSADRRGADELPPLFVPDNIQVYGTVWVVFELLTE